MAHTEEVDPELVKQAKGWENYLQAKLGFRNHWYPVRFSQEVAEGKPIALKALGEPILLNRIDGQVFAIRDRCIHRGVPLSRKIECYTKGTVTCFYHGFTYRFSDGLLVDAIGAPGSKLIGRRHIRTFPATEAKGVVFVFIGDEDAEAPPLAVDVPPGFLDDDVVLRGHHRIVESDWRVGCENGYDSGHIYLHRNAEIVQVASIAMPVSLEVKEYDENYFLEFDNQNGPKGVSCGRATHEVVHFDGKIEGEVVFKANPGKNIVAQRVSIWLPGCLKVDPWPGPNMVHFEWYVPVDENHHLYFQAMTKKVSSAADEADFDRDYNTKYEPYSIFGFNDEDVFAREAMQTYYQDDTAWIDEQLCEQDLKMMRWRQFASKHARGVQRREHLR